MCSGIHSPVMRTSVQVGKRENLVRIQAHVATDAVRPFWMSADIMGCC
jgi:hypothetical protein